MFRNLFKIIRFKPIMLMGVIAQGISVYCISDSIIQQAKLAIENEILLMKKEFGVQMASYPEVIYGVRGNRYYIEFTVDQRRCDIFSLLVIALSILKKEEGVVKINDTIPMNKNEIFNYTIKFEEAIGNPKNKLNAQGTIYISGEMINDRPAFKFTLEKTEEFTQRDIQAFVACYRDANKPREVNFVRHGQKANAAQNTQTNNQKSQTQEAIEKLESMGVTLFLPQQKQLDIDWDYLAGYEKQKRDIEDTVLLALRFPEIYDSITSETRMKNEPNRPKAVLFEGPPGTGKTTSAKIIAQQVQIPLIYLPIEAIMTKWYGEAEKRLSEIWENCQKLGKVIVFIDEIDALAQSREGELHEASRRILSTLLRKIDSFESNTNVLLICATNRKQDLDPAMLSRLDLSIKFELPDNLSRQAIFRRYAKQLNESERKQLSELSNGMSGRNISDVCKDAERRWAAKLIRKEVNDKLPTIDQYLEALNAKVRNFV